MPHGDALGSIGAPSELRILAGCPEGPHAAVLAEHDTLRSRTILFGVDEGGILVVDTWEFDGSRWSRR